MIKGYRDFYYSVELMDRAVKFYESLGFKASYTSDYWTSMNLGNLKLGLHWTEGGGVPDIQHTKHGALCGGTLTLESDDLDKDKAIILNAGASLLSDTNNPWGRMIVFKDLDGNILKMSTAAQE